MLNNFFNNLLTFITTAWLFSHDEMRERDREQHASKIRTRDVAVDGAGAFPVALILTFIKISLLWVPHLYGKAILTHRSSLLRSIFNVYTHCRLFKLSVLFMMLRNTEINCVKLTGQVYPVL